MAQTGHRKIRPGFGTNLFEINLIAGQITRFDPACLFLLVGGSENQMFNGVESRADVLSKPCSD